MSSIVVDEGVFKPTETSQCLIKGVIDGESDPIDALLELGCGCGIVGIELNKRLSINNMFASDISDKAVQNTINNYSNANLSALVKCSSTFEGWPGRLFDVIVDDISGISKHVARISPWFNGISMCDGDDGTKNTIDVIQQAPSHLNDGGRLYFPTISLSNEDKILQVASNVFTHVELILEQQWFIPEQLQSEVSQLQYFKKMGWIQYSEQFGKIIGWTKIYKAINP